MRLGLSHLREHKFKHSFQHIKSYQCLWTRYWNTLSLPHLLRNSLLNNIRQIAPSISNLNHSQITHVLLYGDFSLKNETITEILNSTMNYILSTKSFEGSILQKIIWSPLKYPKSLLFILDKQKFYLEFFCYSQMLTE